MAKSNFNLDKFRSEVLSGSGLARTNRFEVTIAPPVSLAGSYNVSELASLYVEQASIPNLSINTKSLRIFGPAYQRPMSSEYGGEGISMTFHVDQKMMIRRFFEDWMHQIVDPVKFTVNYQENYITDLLIKQLDEQDNVVYEVKLIEAFPRSINLMELNNSSSNQTHRLNVLFAYRYWYNTAIERTNPVPLPRNVKNPQVPVVETQTRLKNVTPTGQFDPGTTNEDMAFGVNGLSG